MSKRFLLGAFLLLAAYLTRSRAADGECARACSTEPFARRLCFYEFFVAELPPAARRGCNQTESNEDCPTCGNELEERSFLGINGKSPGPSIEVCLGDVVEVVVHNGLKASELSLHWHGIRQKGTAYMDGVPMVTQCPILPYSRFRYMFKPEQTGTYFYRAHSVSQHGDGVYGSLTVRGPPDERSLERTLLLSSRTPTPLTSRSHLQPPTPAEILVNGQAMVALPVARGSAHLLRLSNAVAQNCPILLGAARHRFRVLAADGNPVRSMVATHLLLFPGERIDAVLDADQDPGRYLLDIRGLGDCRHLTYEAYFQYEGIDDNAIPVEDRNPISEEDYPLLEQGHDCYRVSKTLMCALDLKSLTPLQSEKDELVSTIYVPFDVNTYAFITDAMTDHRYNMYSNVYYPTYLSMSVEPAIAQVNHMSFLYPSSPLLSQPGKTADEYICSLENRSHKCSETPLFCECVQIVEVPYNRTVEVVLINKGFGGSASHTFHTHGYNVSVLGRGRFKIPITKEDVEQMDLKGLLARDLTDPPRKDTFVVPNKGYLVLRFHTDNIGYWLWEARSTGIAPALLGPPMQFVMKVGSRESQLPVPLNFPTCFSNKAPDQVFGTD